MGARKPQQAQVPYTTVVMCVLLTAVVFHYAPAPKGWDLETGPALVFRPPMNATNANVIVRSVDSNEDGTISETEAKLLVSHLRGIAFIRLSPQHPEVLEFRGSSRDLFYRLYEGRHDKGALEPKIKAEPGSWASFLESHSSAADQEAAKAAAEKAAAEEAREANERSEKQERADKEAATKLEEAKHSAARKAADEEAAKHDAVEAAERRRKATEEKLSKRKKAQQEKSQAASQLNSNPGRNINPLMKPKKSNPFRLKTRTRLAQACVDASCGWVQDDQKCNTLGHDRQVIEWLDSVTEHLVLVAPRCFLQAGLEADALSALVASEGVAKGGTLFRLDASAGLTLARASEQLTKLWDITDNSASPHARLLARQEARHGLEIVQERTESLSAGLKLALCLMQTDVGQWRGLVRWPEPDRVLSLWSPDRIQELAETSYIQSDELEPVLAQIKMIGKQWDSQIVPIIDELREATDTELGWSQVRFHQALHLVHASAVSLPTRELFVLPGLQRLPVAPMNAASVRVKLDKGQISVVANRNLSSGELLVLGVDRTWSNMQLLLMYGHVDPDNLFESVVVEMGDANAWLQMLVSRGLALPESVKPKLEWLSSLLQTRDKMLQVHLQALRMPQHSVKSWMIPSEMVASSRMLALSLEQMKDPRCIEDVLDGRALTAITELRAASVMLAQIQAQIGRFTTTLDEDLASLNKAKKTGSRSMLLFRIRRKEILRDLSLSLQGRQECLHSFIMHKHAELPASTKKTTLCKELLAELHDECRGFSKAAGASVLSTKAVRMLGSNMATTKWALRKRRLDKQCNQSNSTECSTWRNKVDSELKRSEQQVNGICGGMLVHASHDADAGALVNRCKIFKDAMYSKHKINVAAT